MNHKTMGIVFFALAGVINLVATLAFSELHALDWIILAVFSLPALIRKRLFLLAYGMTFALLLSLSLFLGLIYVLDARHNTSAAHFIQGLLLGGSLLSASFFLMTSQKSGHLFRKVKVTV